MTGICKKGEKVADLYNKYLADLTEYIQLPVEKNWARHAFWMYSIQLKETLNISRDDFITALQKCGIETRPVFYPMHILPPYKETRSQYPKAEKIASRGINLPTHGKLCENDVKFISDTIRTLCECFTR